MHIKHQSTSGQNGNLGVHAPLKGTVTAGFHLKQQFVQFRRLKVDQNPTTTRAQN